MEDKLKTWIELKIKEQENRLVLLKKENEVLRHRLGFVEEKLDSLNNAFMKFWRKNEK